MGWKMLHNGWKNKHYYKNFGMVSSAPPDYFEQVATFNVIRNGAAPSFDVQITVDETVNIYLTQSYDMMNSTDLAALEARFQNSSTETNCCYVSTYNYDENLT